MELRDRVVVVTGGGSGIGEAIAIAAKEEGARHVVVADLSETNAQRVAQLVGGTGIGIDVRNEAAIVALVEQTESAHGPIDLFVSNAGFVTTGGVEDSNERIQNMWEVHVMAHLYAARAVLPSMIARGEGYLLNTASAAGLLTQIGSLSYSITKHAAVSLAEWLSISHHHQGIRVSVLCPQAVETNIVANSPDRFGGADDADSGLGGGVAGADGVKSSADVAQSCIEAIRNEKFHVLPHEEVQTYMERKATDVDRWLSGMRRFQSSLYAGGPLPGDAIAPKL
jgi:NAD(P)-dependent dehydrogenase (short-subunit alcohol dehydrogenase family)